MPEITDHIKLELIEQEATWIKIDIIYEFQVNPSTLDISSDVQVVESAFLRKDGAIQRITQRRPRKITGSGKFMDIPQYPAVQASQTFKVDIAGRQIYVPNNDQFPLIKSSPKKTSFEMYQLLLQYMNLKQIFRFVHQYFGEIYVIIQSLNIKNTSSVNTVDFDFVLLETIIDNNNRTGFERDDQQKTKGMAISSITEQESNIQYKEYKVVGGDTLSKIALKFYGNAQKWSLIYDYNRDVLTRGPNFLQIGITLKIPNSTSAPNTVSNGSTPNINNTQPTATCDNTVLDSLGQPICSQYSQTKKEALQYCTANIPRPSKTVVSLTFDAIFKTIKSLKTTAQKVSPTCKCP
jgi:LysM repeat protein